MKPRLLVWLRLAATSAAGDPYRTAEEVGQPVRDEERCGASYGEAEQTRGGVRRREAGSVMTFYGKD